MTIEAFGGAVRHWRIKKQRYSLVGEKDEHGNVNFPPGPHKPKFSLNGNGRREENPLEGAAVYQNPQTEKADG